MEIRKSKSGDVTILQLSGRLDSNTSPTLEKHLQESIETGEHQILIDFEKLNFISSSGLRVLLSAGKQLKGGSRKLVLCSLQDQVREVFDVAGFTMLFAIHPSHEEALKQF